METEKGVGNDSPKINKYAAYCSIVASMISIIFGYDTGVMSGAMIFVREEFEINDTQVQILAGILNICALVGSLCAGRTADRIGRLYTIFTSAIIFLLGSVIMGYSPNYAVLLIGRCTAGIGVGFALMIAPVYTAEISSPEHRGFLTSLPEIGISTGVLLGYVANYSLGQVKPELGWRLMLGIAAIPSLFLAIGILFMPESPRWLIMQGKLGEGKKILYKVSNNVEEAESRISDIKLAAGIEQNCDDEIVKIPSSRTTHGEGVWKELFIKPLPHVRWMLLAAIGIHFFEHATGIEAVILYGPKIFKKAGVESKNKLLLATVGIGLSKLTFIIIATFLIDKVGRRKLLLTSVAGMIVTSTCLGACLTVVNKTEGKILWALVLGLMSVYGYVMFFNLGLGPITWVYSSEIFPLKLRAQGAAVAVAVNRLTNATVSMTFLSISNAITIGGTFFMFASIAVVAWIFFYQFCPETKGISLEEMEALFTRGNKSKNVTRSVELQNN